VLDPSRKHQYRALAVDLTESFAHCQETKEKWKREEVAKEEKTEERKESWKSKPRRGRTAWKMRERK
jgi:hypothetical protein